MNADGANALEIEVLNIRRRRLKYHLKLKVFVKAVGIFAVAPVGGTPAGLHVSHSIGLRPEHPKERLGVHGPRADFDVIWLLKNAIAVGPEFFKLQDKILKVRPTSFAGFAFSSCG